MEQRNICSWRKIKGEGGAEGESRGRGAFNIVSRSTQASLRVVHATSLRNHCFRLLNAGGVLQSDSDSDDGGGGGDIGMEGEKNRDKAAKGISAKEG